MDQELEEKLTCKVCLGQFDGSAHRPLLLPACGHTFCTSCLNQLVKQSKTSCPECRQNTAIKDTSSLPVNYGLLSIAQARQSTASASSAPLTPTSPPQPLFPLPRNQLLRYQQAASAPRHSPPRQQSFAMSPRPVTHVQGVKNKRALRVRSGRVGQHQSPQSCTPDNTLSSDKGLQEELDFQMAVHLTFCKDASHGHDEPGSAQHRCWQFPQDDELTTVTAQSRIYQDYEDYYED